jgi:hypothetical protein
MTRAEVLQTLVDKGYKPSEESYTPQKPITLLWPVLLDGVWKNARMDSTLTFRNKAGKYLPGVTRKEGFTDAGKILDDLERDMDAE